MGNFEKDQKLLDRIRNGDKGAFEELYLATYPKIVNFLKKQYASLEDAKDGAQLTFLIFLEKIRDGMLVTLTSSLRTYLTAIAKNLNHHLYKQQAQTTQLLKEVSSNNHTQQELTDLFEREEALEVVESMLSTLKDKCFALIYHTFYYKKSNGEIAQQLNYKNAKEVSKLKDRCMKKFRKLVIAECKRRGFWV